MAIKNSENKRDENLPGHLIEMPAFIVKENPRISEAEQLRLEKRARIFFKEAMVKMRGRQWDLALQDLEETRRICKIINWPEGSARIDEMREMLASKKSSDSIETHSRVARERFNKNQSARAQRVSAEHARLDQMHEAARERMLKLRNVIQSSKNLEIGRLAGMLDLDEAFVKNQASCWVDQFGFKISSNKIIFGNGKIDDFIDALDKQFSS
ncbi:MAG TPA: hypothetical protein VKM55_09415 [Candidatus Lokiarchaeia archaeon]|nr:hypothetical protein [Candidatus Lokiarchaeia archaeon]